MRDSFLGYYPLTTEEFDRLWDEALIVLDTNTLLGLYRLQPIARQEFLAVLTHVRDRLWIPHQVGLEFQRNRVGVIADRRKKTQELAASVAESYDKLVEAVKNLRLERYAAELDPTKSLQSIDEPIRVIKGYAERAVAAELQISSVDPIRAEIDKLLEGRIGPAPATQDALDLLCKDGESRYKNDIPPGFSDIRKEEIYIYDGLVYESRYGDLILWRQLIEYMSGRGGCVLLVTSDKKADWWWQERDGAPKTIGPHTALMREIKREAGVELFWMYSADKFLEYAATKMQDKVSQDSVEQVRDIVNKDNQLHEVRDGGIDEFTFKAPEWAAERTNPFIAAWLQENRGDVTANSFGPDFAVHLGADVIFYDVIRVPNYPSKALSLEAVMARIQALQGSVNKGSPFRIALIIIINSIARFSFMSRSAKFELTRSLRNLGQMANIEEIILGFLDARTSGFSVLLEVGTRADGSISTPSDNPFA
ncbi:PIN-like domain-containing protein [Rhizobium phaseoli]|nr:PIN-like domain-containing protein [Rhizobium phaseoli]MDK4727913.1 PIN-like domain-containing protein [Rhizobium phaseoli]NKE87800.1 DUF4935 domain-containing protein [Rhizobium phaseoli]